MPVGDQNRAVLLVAAHLDLDRHDPGRSHPENHTRLVAAVAGLGGAGVAGALDWLPARRATRAELGLAHDVGYLDALADLCAAGGGQLDADTVVSPGTWDTACTTAGGGLGAAEALAGGRGEAALVLGRPPGHHATRNSGMGFCVVNNIAVTAAVLAAKGERVAVIDWDVHHGNGTQDIFWDNSSVLYVSIHQSPLYPGTGQPDERGGSAGRGATINLPLPPGATGDTYLALFDEILAPCITGFRPTWILISAGFDAHRADPLADMALTAGDYADLTGRVIDLAIPGRLILFLEGGYDPTAVRSSVGACAARLVGETYRPEPASSGGSGMSHVASYREIFLGTTDLA
jgi:acetoin utilization deacetylase AcuC-like enzyme